MVLWLDAQHRTGKLRSTASEERSRRKLGALGLLQEAPRTSSKREDSLSGRSFKKTVPTTCGLWVPAGFIPSAPGKQIALLWLRTQRLHLRRKQSRATAQRRPSSTLPVLLSGVLWVQKPPAR